MKCGFWGRWPRAARAAEGNPASRSGRAGGSEPAVELPGVPAVSVNNLGGGSASRERPSCFGASVSSSRQSLS